jgi:hypothetical protein
MEKKIFKLLIFGLCMSLSVAGQTEGYEFRAAISHIKNSGFHDIVLTPGINAHLKTDYSDLRIINSKGKWVPHLLRLPGAKLTATGGLSERSILKNISNNDVTEIVAETGKSVISSLLIETTNSAVERFCALTGSDDSANWFIINDSIRVRSRPFGENGKSALIIEFPPNNYRFYKVLIYNKGTAPFKIIKMFSASAAPDTAADLHNYIENPSSSLTQRDSGKFSIIKITQPARYHVEKIALSISAVKYFNRKVELYVRRSGTLPGELLSTFFISNTSDLRFTIPLINADSFLLLVYNEDNLPLKIEKVRTFSSYRSVAAYLEKGEPYQLLMGNKLALPPDYDLREGNPELNKNLPQASIGAITATGDTGKDSASPHHNQRMIWLVISAAALVLGFFTYKLIADMNKKEKA